MKARKLLVIGFASVTLLAAAAGADALPAVAQTPSVAWEPNVAANPTNMSAGDVEPEVLDLSVNATGGTFAVTIEEDRTAPIPYNASGEEVKAAIDALGSVGGVGGEVTVTGGPGGPGASSPYVVSVGGSLAGDNFASVEENGEELTGGTFNIDRAFRGRFPDIYLVSLANVGAVGSEGPITVLDTLPRGVKPAGTITSSDGSWACSATGQVVTCTSETPILPLRQTGAIFIPVLVESGAEASVTDTVTVSGGGAPECGGGGQPECASASTTTTLNGPTPEYQALNFRSGTLGSGGLADTQAGDHLASLTTKFDLPTAVGVHENVLSPYVVQSVKQVVIDLPKGLVGNAQATPTCALSDLANAGGCASDTQVGFMELREPPPPTWSGAEVDLPIFNVVPEAGHPAEFGVFVPVLQRDVLLYASVRSSDYGVRVTSQPLPRAIPISGVSTIFFGNPGRQDGGTDSPFPFLTNPSDCSQSEFTTTIHADSWQEPGSFNSDGTPDFSDPNWKSASFDSPPVSGCEKLSFRPAISVAPSTTAGDSPTGLNVDLTVPQNNNAIGTATPPVKTVSLVLPQGIAISPSGADGLQGCTDAQIGLGSSLLGSCPDGSALGTVVIHTPVLGAPLEGRLFLGTPECDPCTDAKGDAPSGRMVRLFIEAQGSGVVIKLAGRVSVDASTGQLTARFAENPEQPFDDLQIKLKEGPRAPLVTPAACGSYSSTADVAAWSAPATPNAELGSSFAISQCDAANVFTPSFLAGTVNPQAGAFSPFTLTIERSDADQQFAGLSVSLPPGLLAKLAGVPLCADEAADTGTCPAATQVGDVAVAAGPGSHPYSLTGRAYLTGPYRGAPYGLSVEVPAVAGPFNLGIVVVRQALYIDPNDLHVTDVSDPFPTILDGIPLQIRSVSVSIDRPGFTLNPTSCAAGQVSGALSSTGGLGAAESSRFQVGGCASLPFGATLTAATQGNPSKALGASLHVKVVSRSGEANIRKVRVVLPKQLPSRLTTLQKACLAAVFDANPAACPPGSAVGTAVAVTPLLSQPLSGPAYLVSHGGVEFPDLVVVLQGEGITVDLDGKTNIHNGITTSEFRTVPDAPVSTFDLTLPESRTSLFSAFGSLCKPTTTTTVRRRIVRRDKNGKLHHEVRRTKVTIPQKLTLGTTMTAQSGVVTNRSATISVSGCTKTKTSGGGKAKAKKKHRKS